MRCRRAGPRRAPAAAGARPHPSCSSARPRPGCLRTTRSSDRGARGRGSRSLNRGRRPVRPAGAPVLAEVRYDASIFSKCGTSKSLSRSGRIRPRRGHRCHHRPSAPACGPPCGLAQGQSVAAPVRAAGGWRRSAGISAHCRTRRTPGHTPRSRPPGPNRPVRRRAAQHRARPPENQVTFRRPPARRLRSAAGSSGNAPAAPAGDPPSGQRQIGRAGEILSQELRSITSLPCCSAG